MFRTLEWSMGLSEGSLQGAGGAVPGTEPFPERRAGRGSPGPQKSGRKSDDLWVTLPCHGRT